MKVIIAGGGEVAYQIARELDERLDIVVIEDDPDAAARFERLDVQVVRGSPTDATLLQQLEIGPEDHFVACSDSDESNLVASLAVKSLTDVRTTCFVTHESNYRSFIRPESGEPLLNIDRLISPPTLLAEEIARIVLVPRAIDVNTFLGGRIWLQEYRIPIRSGLVGHPLSRLGLPGSLLAVGLVRGEELIIPDGRTVPQADDKIVFMGTQQALRQLERKFLREVIERVGLVTIVGGGEVGLAVARRLEEEGDVEVKLIERDEQRCEFLASLLKRCLVLHGDGTDLELLDLEQVYRSDVLVSVTSDDEKNLLCSLLAREMEIPKIVTRVNNPGNVHLFESVRIDVPLNPRTTAIKTVLDSLQSTQVPLLATVEKGKGSVVEITVRPGFKPTPVRDLPQVGEVVIGAVVRDYKTFVPHGDDVIRPGDRLLVFTLQEDSTSLSEMF
jgi:trk system potassium uptake protein TrkA